MAEKNNKTCYNFSAKTEDMKFKWIEAIRMALYAPLLSSSYIKFLFLISLGIKIQCNITETQFFCTVSAVLQTLPSVISVLKKQSNQAKTKQDII